MMMGRTVRPTHVGESHILARDLVSSRDRVDGRVTTGEAARALVGSAVSTLPVCDEDGRLAGLLTAHDLLQAALADPDWQHRPVERAMHRAGGWAVEDAQAEWVLVEMTETQNWALPVVDHDQYLLGMVCLPDLAGAIRSLVLADVCRRLCQSIHP